MLSAQCDELRDKAKLLRGHADGLKAPYVIPSTKELMALTMLDSAMRMEEAADTIISLRDRLQASELGSGTCIVTHDFKCSNCGKQIGVVRNCEMYETCDGRQAWKSLDHEVCDITNFCSNCGAKVVGR